MTVELLLFKTALAWPYSESFSWSNAKIYIVVMMYQKNKPKKHLRGREDDCNENFDTVFLQLQVVKVKIAFF